MCGLTGFWDPAGDRSQHLKVLIGMTDAIRHRGPDDSGSYCGDNGVALGHRRLAIIDLSPNGHQPMASASGRFQLVFNGEIYNFPLLAQELKGLGHKFRGSSDTEVLLAAMESWGIAQTLGRINGMFAFAVQDLETGELVLARDRLGIKPMFYSFANNRLIFGSELKSLMAHPALPKELDEHALCHYLRLGYVPAPASIFKQVRKLEPGHLMRFSMSSGVLTSSGPTAFWHLADVVDAAKAAPFKGSDQQAVAGFKHELDRVVGEHLLADVPLGAFLSGGIDSSLVVAAMQRAAAGKVKTFSIGFKDHGYNEAQHAREVAEHLGTEHHELFLEEQQLLELVDELPKIWCEPFGDSSQLPSLLLARFARKHVTVALSGDGGDELAAGYVRHINAARLTRWQGFPLLPRTLLGRCLHALPTAVYDSIFKLVPESRRMRLPGDKIHKLARALQAAGAEDLYREVVSLDTLGPLTTLGFRPASGDNGFPWRMPKTALTPAEDFMVRDSFRYLPDDMLTKVDRATMAAGLEARVPLLDADLMAYVWSMPESLKLRGGVGKWLLRETLAQDVPRALWERPKMGFAAPVGAWLRETLRPWAEDLMADVSAGKTPYLEVGRTLTLWQNHLAGRGNTTSPMWHLLMFLAWRREYLP